MINLKKVVKYIFVMEGIFFIIIIKIYYIKYLYIILLQNRLSNRTLLMRYGITLEYNKYDHVYIKKEFINEL